MNEMPKAKIVKAKATKIKVPAELSREDLIVLARHDFLVFLNLMFPVLYPETKLVHARYIELIVECLTILPDVENPRMIFNLPPGYMKSTIISILFTAWKLGVDPTVRLICISYGDSLAHELSERTRSVMQSEIYAKIFPGTVLEKKAQDHLKTTKGGARFATSVGSDITGFRANIIIIDDPIQPDEAESERVKNEVQKWFYSSVLTRLIDLRTDAIILVMHRLSPNDLAGVLEQVGWHTFKLPMVAEIDTEIEIGLNFHWHRKVGELLNPDRMSTEDVERLRKELPPHVYEAQYQQRPTTSGSGLFAIDRVERYDRPPPFELTIHSWDVAGTENGNYSVCTKFGLYKDPDIGDLLYQLDVIRIRVSLPDLEQAIEAQMKLDKPALVVVDSRGLGLGVLQVLQRKYGMHQVMGGAIDASTKLERYGIAMQYTYRGRVWLPSSAPWLESWLFEMIAFPDGQFNDQVDSFTQIVGYFEKVIWFARQALRF